MSNQLLRHITPLWQLPLLLCGLLSCLLASCDRSTEEVVPWPEGGLPVEFRIRVESGAQSRALPGEDGTVDKGSGYENYIQLDDMCFLLFNATDDTYIGRFTPNTLIPVDTSGAEVNSDPYEWIVQGTLPEDFASQTSFKLVVLANWGEGTYSKLGLNNTMTIEDICSSEASIYAYPYSSSSSSPFIPSEENRIPMYGVKTYKDATSIIFRADLMTDLGQIDLLRAMAKVEVSCAEHLELANVVLTRCNNKGYCAPLGIYDNTEYVEEVHIPDTDVQVVTDLPFTKQEDGSWVIYVPEYKNEGMVKITFDLYEKKGDGTTTEVLGDKNVYFKDYSVENGDNFDIIRNYYYRFYIRSVTSEPVIYYTVCPWNEKKINIPAFQ